MRRYFAVAIPICLCGCGGSGSNAPGTHALGGSVSGLLGSGLTLTSGTGQTVAVSADGPFTFPARLASGSSFYVSVVTQPSKPTQTCKVAHSLGSIDTTDITNVAVSCTTNTYAIGGTVSGLGSSSGLVVTDSLNSQTIYGDSTFNFVTPVASGSAYDVTVSTQPTNPGKTCVINNGTGTVGASNVSVSVVCTINNFSIGGGVTGLTGSGLVLTLNSGSPLAVTSNGQFTFPGVVQTATQYTVAIESQPANPAQTCKLLNPSGTLPNSPVTSVAVICANPIGRFAYVSNIVSPSPPEGPTPPGTVSAYTINPADGSFSLISGPVAAGQTPNRITLDPLGRFAYVGNCCDVNDFPVPGTISAYTIDPVSGTLTPAADNPMTLADKGNHPIVTIGALGKFAYVTTDDGINGGPRLSQYAINQTTGNLSVVSTGIIATFESGSLVVEPTGKFGYAVEFTPGADPTNGNGLVIAPQVIDSTTGSPTAGPTPAQATDAYALTLDPTGRFIYASTRSGKIYGFSIDAATGALTPVAGSPYTVGGVQSIPTLSVDPRGAFLYLVECDQNLPPSGCLSILVIPIDSATGQLGTASTLALGVSQNGYVDLSLKFDPSGHYAYLPNGNLLGFSVNSATGALTPLASPLNVGAYSGAVALLR